MPEVFEALNSGDRVFFDDGKIGGVVVATRSSDADIRITMAAPGGSKLRAEKGINVPDSGLHLPAIGPDDERILRFVVDHADLVELSFAQSSSDVSSLRHHLEELGGGDIGIVLKIETVRGFTALAKRTGLMPRPRRDRTSGCGRSGGDGLELRWGHGGAR